MPTFIPSSLTEAINGASPLTHAIAAHLGAATGDDLQATTLLSISGELFVQKDFRSVRYWCPVCVSIDPHDALMTSLSDVETCLEHEVRLVDQPRCGHSHLPWGQRVSPAECPSCDAPLADAEIIHAKPGPLESAYASVIEWLQQGGSITRRSIVAGVRALQAERKTTSTALARAADLSPSTVDALLSGSVAPSLSTLPRLIVFADWDLGRLLGYGDAEVASRRVNRPPQSARRDLTELEALLRAELLLPIEQRRPLRSIAQQCGVHAWYPRIHLLELTQPWIDAGLRRRGRPRRAA